MKRHAPDHAKPEINPKSLQGVTVILDHEYAQRGRIGQGGIHIKWDRLEIAPFLAYAKGRNNKQSAQTLASLTRRRDVDHGCCKPGQPFVGSGLLRERRL
jgi:hypothetical protein